MATRLRVFLLDHPARGEIERLWSLVGDLERTKTAVQLLIGPPELFRVAGMFAGALYTQALVSYVRCFASGRRKGLDRNLFDDRPDLQKIHDDVKAIRDRHVSHPVGDYERCTMLIAAKDEDSAAKGIGVHHLFFSGAGAKDLKAFLKVVSFAHKYVSSELTRVGDTVAKDVIGKGATWSSAQKQFWKSVSGEDVYGPGW